MSVFANSTERPAAELSDRPRKTLGWNTSAALLAAAQSQRAHS
jgi:IS30 family transposase